MKEKVLVALCFFLIVGGKLSSQTENKTTGSFTIPMMKDEGYDKEWSAAISAVGSCGGQLMPPIMGSAAFIMAQLIGVPYMSIAKAALLPAILYYLGAFVAIHYSSKRLGIKVIGGKAW